MAAEMKARQNKNPTIAFTLPISCQVCLGKVKNPVLCPNQHVFCGPCMEVWLQKNKQCPACRTAMTSGKKIIGGLSQQEDDRDKLTNPDLRKARFDLLYKEYENEFERMHSEIQLLKTENQILKQQRKKEIPQSGRSSSDSSKSAADTNHLLALTKKLQDATKQYEKVKEELSQLKQENVNLKDENLSLNRENQHVRQELAGRSPHRYGRITVTTLESKLASAEKDVTRLTKALERSDKYIEELESELEDYRGKSTSSKRPSSGLDRDDKYLMNGDSRKFSSDSKLTSRESTVGQDMPSKRQLFSDGSDMKSSTGEHGKHYYEQNGDYKEDYRSSGRYQNSKSAGISNGKKRVTFDLEKNTNSAISFDLELPSPLKTSANASGLVNGRSSSPVKGVLKKAGNGAGKASSSDNRASDKSSYSTDLSKDSLSDSYNLRSTDTKDYYSKDDDLLYLKSRSTSSGYRDTDDTTQYSKNRRKYSADDSILSEPSEFDSHRSRDYSSKSRSSDRDYDRNHRSDNIDGLDLEPPSRSRSDARDRPDLDDTLHIESELDELNISLTPEFTDCMKILNRAEKNVHKTVPDMSEEVAKYTSRASDTDLLKYPTRSSDNDLGKYTTRSSDNDLGKYTTRSSDNDLGKYTTRSSDIDLDKYTSRPSDNDMDKVFRASTGSIGQKSSGYNDDFTSKYKTDNLKFTSSDNLSHGGGRHVRSGSLDNLFIDKPADPFERPASALGSASSMYPPTSQNKYMSGLTTGRTSLTRTPSLDNLLITRPGSSTQNKYGYLDGGYSSHTGRRLFGEENKALDVNTVSGSGLTNTAPVPAKHDIIGSQGIESRDRYASKGFESAVDSHARDYTSGTYSVTSSSTNDFDNGRKFAPSGRQTPTLPISGGGGSGDLDKQYSTGGRVTPTIPTHSEYMALSKPTSDKYTYSSALTSSGRSTPTLLSEFSTATKPGSHFSSGPMSLPSDLSQKPPTGFRGQDSGPQRSANVGSYSSLPPSYKSTSAYTDTNTNTEDFFSLPTYINTANTGDGRTQADGKYSVSAGKNSDTGFDKLNFVPSSNYNADDRYSSVSKTATYNDNNYKDGTDFSNFSTKIGVNNNYPYSSSSLVSQANFVSASSAGPSSSSSLGLGLSSYPGPSSYMPTTMTSSLTSSLASSSSYSTALSVPLTSTTSAYTSSVPASSYATKPLDPITETGHYSYVSNVSGDYSSKNDTFALPEPKKRLFDNSDDLDMSVSPIKSNRRY